MIRVSNIRIGTKLAAASGLSIALVLGMMAIQWMNNSHLDTLQEVQTRQNSIVMDALDAKADARGMVTAVRDLQLSNDAKAAEAAKASKANAKVSLWIVRRMADAPVAAVRKRFEMQTAYQRVGNFPSRSAFGRAVRPHGRIESLACQVFSAPNPRG